MPCTPPTFLLLVSPRKAFAEGTFGTRGTPAPLGAPTSRELYGVDRALGAGTVPRGTAGVCLAWQMRLLWGLQPAPQAMPTAAGWDEGKSPSHPRHAGNAPSVINSMCLQTENSHFPPPPPSPPQAATPSPYLPPPKPSPSPDPPWPSSGAAQPCKSPTSCANIAGTAVIPVSNVNYEIFPPITTAPPRPAACVQGRGD